MRRIIPLLFIFLAISCCQSGGDYVSRFHEDGRAKPSVAIASVIDTTSLNVPWNVSEELTSLIVQRVSQDGSIYAMVKDDVGYTENPFSSDFSWVKREFPDNEFVVFLELVEHENAPVLNSGKNQPHVEIPFETSINLKLAMRMRVIDLRTPLPRIVLQEMVRNTYYIPKNTIPVDYRVATWGSSSYASSPMNLAHLQLAQKVSTRVNEYIHLAKSR